MISEYGYKSLNNDDIKTILQEIEKHRLYKIEKVKKCRDSLTHLQDSMLKSTMRSTYSMVGE